MCLPLRDPLMSRGHPNGATWTNTATIERMLSETDIHYLTAFLYLATHSEDIEIVLGEKVYDVASESSRDVDIVIAASNDHGIIGVEVKDEGRAMHVGLVEALCQKFADMPSLTERWIVSASGYTEPALRKASAHKVQCLRLVRGRVPHFDSISISNLNEFVVSYLEWRQGPAIQLIPSTDLTSEQRAELNDNSPVVVREKTPSSPGTARQLADHIVALATSEWAGPDQTEGPLPANLQVEVADVPVIALKSGSISIIGAHITGTVEWVTSVAPIESACYLEMSDGTAVAGTAVISIRTGLLGVAVSPSNQRVRYFHIPN